MAEYAIYKGDQFIDLGTADYAQYVAYSFEGLTGEYYLMFNPANYSSVEIKNLGKIEELDNENN